MTDQPLAKAMIDQPGIADIAGEAVAAGAAQRQRSIAAPIEKQQRLLAALDGVQNSLCKARRNEAAAIRAFDAQIDRLDVRHMLATEAGRQGDTAVAALAGIDFGFDRRCRRRQHNRNFGDMGAHHRHVARVIVRAFVLLVGLVVFLIDDDQA